MYMCVYNMYVYVYVYINRSTELEGEAVKRSTSLANRSKRYLNSLYTFLSPSPSFARLPPSSQLVFFFFSFALGFDSTESSFFIVKTREELYRVLTAVGRRSQTRVDRS